MKCDLDVADIGCNEEDGDVIEIENDQQYFKYSCLTTLTL